MWTAIWTLLKTLWAGVTIRSDESDLMLAVGSLMVAVGMAWYSIPAAMIVVGGGLVAIAIYNASK